MKLIKQSSEILEQQPGIKGIEQMIEIAGRTAYKSHDNITETSAKEFVQRMIKSGHGAVLEHGTVYLNIHWDVNNHPICKDMFGFYNTNKYSKCTKRIIDTSAKSDLCSDLFIVTNMRVLVENNRLDDLKYLCEPTKYHERRVTVKLITSISISREYNRHRVNSIVEQSTRFCNYSREKFNNEITFIEPYWYNTAENYIKDEFIKSLQHAENSYMSFINAGLKPQEAREILPLDTATELVHTAFLSDWKHFFSLRCPEYGAKGVHPQAAELATMIYNQFKTLNYVKLSSRS